MRRPRGRRQPITQDPRRICGYSKNVPRELCQLRSRDDPSSARALAERTSRAVMPYDPFRRATPGPTPREEIFVWSFVKDVRTFTGSLRAVDDERWEVLYRANNDLYKSQVFTSRTLAEHDLMRTKDALEATGWQQSRPPEKPKGGN